MPDARLPETVRSAQILRPVVAMLVCSGICIAAPAEDAYTQSPWRLFIDDYWIESSAHVTSTLHRPKKHRDNPLIPGEDPWALNPYCFGSVIYDDEESIFKIWYMSYNFGLPLNDRTPVLYATSTDGIEWTRPNLGVHAFQGSTDNNIVLTNYGHHDLYAPSVIKDASDPNPDRRYKMIWWDFPLGDTSYQDEGMCVAFSPDGIHWAKHPGNPLLHAKKRERSISDVMSVMHDRRTGKYVAYTKGWADPWPAFRQIVRTESSDFVNWSEPEVVIRHAHDTQDPQSYGMTVSRIGDVAIGLMCSYKKPGDETIDIQLAVSRDNVTWARAADQATFIPVGPAGSWDDGMLFTAPAIERGDQTLIYYGGWNGPHNASRDRRSGIGLATLRKHGFVSLDAGTETGEVISRAFVNFRGPLLVNANSEGGSLRAELLDAKGDPLPGYSLADSVPLQADATSQTLRWHDHSEMPRTKPALRIRFVMTNTSLYSFYAGPAISRIDE